MKEFKFNLLDRVVHKSVSDYPIYLVVARGMFEEVDCTSALYYCKNCDGALTKFFEYELKKVPDE